MDFPDSKYLLPPVSQPYLLPPAVARQFLSLYGAGYTREINLTGLTKIVSNFLQPSDTTAPSNFSFKNCLPARLRGGSNVSVFDVLPQISTASNDPYLKI